MSDSLPRRWRYYKGQSVVWWPSASQDILTMSFVSYAGDKQCIITSPDRGLICVDLADIRRV